MWGSNSLSFEQDRNFSWGNWAPIQTKERQQRKKDEREKPLLFKRHKAVRFLISPKIKKVKIEDNKIMNPAFLLGTAFNIAYWHRKYHSGIS